MLPLRGPFEAAGRLRRVVMGEQNELEPAEAEPVQELVEDLEVSDGAEDVVGGTGTGFIAPRGPAGPGG
jgi:hypothetical protein